MALEKKSDNPLAIHHAINYAYPHRSNVMNTAAYDLPSVKKLKEIAKDRAKELRSILELTTWKDLEVILGNYPNTKRWADSLRIAPSFHACKMKMANEVLGAHGVGYIARGHNAKSPAIEYCNAGDTYTSTLLFVNGRYRVGCWGDIVERGNYD